MKTKCSIQDVARKAGVSVATVSRTFQYPERVAERTRELVMSVVRELNYSPNAQARSLRTSRTMLIVALIPDIANPFFSELIRGVEYIAKQHHYSVLLGDTQYDIQQEQRYGDMVSSHQVDGMLTCIPRMPRIRVSGRIPVVNASEPLGDPTISSVMIDNGAAFREAVSYLLALGHRNIAFVGGPSATSDARRKGFDAALAAAGIPIVPELCQTSDSFSIESGIRVADLILSYGLPVTAFACVSDQLAIGVLQTLRTRGISVPNEVSVLGFDDISYSRFTEPPLTTVVHPRDEMGREAMLMLVRLLSDPKVPPRMLLLNTQLVIRGSTGPPPR